MPCCSGARWPETVSTTFGYCRVYHWSVLWSGSSNRRTGCEFVVTMHRANGPLIDPNAWVALHNIFFFVVLSQYLIDKKRSYATMRLLEGLMFLFAVALFCAYSRGATVVWLATFSFVVLIALLGRLDRKNPDGNTSVGTGVFNCAWLCSSERCLS